MNDPIIGQANYSPVAEPQAQPAVRHDAPEISVILPVYDEREVIRDSIIRLIRYLESLGRTFEVIAVNDGSKDGTDTVLHDLCYEFPVHLRLINHPYNKGNGAAVKTGIRSSRGWVIACMDADGQHDPCDLGRMLSYMDEYDLVIGTRARNYQGKWYRNLANKIYNGLASWLTQFRIEDLTSGYRLFRASVVKKYVSLFPSRFSYPATSTLVFLKGGYSIKFVPINIKPRQGGSSKIRLFHDGGRFLIIIFKIVLLFEPLRLFLPIALIAFLLAGASMLYDTWTLQTLHIPNSSVLLFVMGLFVLLLGFLSEQITSIQVSLRDAVDQRDLDESEF